MKVSTFPTDDLSLDDAPAFESQSDDDLQISLPEATDELRAMIEQRERKIRLASDKIRQRERTLSELEQRYRERVERLKAREAKIKDAVARRRAKSTTDPPAADQF